MGYAPRLNTARLRRERNTGIRQVLGNSVREHVLGVAELEDPGQVDVTAHDVHLDEFARGVKALYISQTLQTIRRHNAPFALTFSW